MSPRADALRTVDQFQGEIAAIRAAPDPFSARATLYLLTAMVVAFAALLVFAHVDRTVSSAGGRIVATVTPNVFQALDASIIKSIDVNEGEHVAKGQLLATLDPTFAAADVNQLREQIASLEAQIARDEAELAGGDLVFADGANDRYGKIQLALFSQRRAQYDAQINSFDQKIAQTQATIDKFQTDEAHYAEREAIAKQIEDMRNTLLQKGAGSLLNLLTSTDTRIEALRTLDFGHNSLVEAQHQLSSLQADREAFIQQWLSALSQDLVTARNSLDGAPQPARQGHQAPGPRSTCRARGLVRPFAGQAQRRLRAQGGRPAADAGVARTSRSRRRWSLPRATSASCARAIPPR